MSASTTARTVHMVVHGGRTSAVSAASTVFAGLSSHDIALTVAAADDPTGELAAGGIIVDDSPAGTQLVLAFGGDGTMLRAAEIAMAHGAPLLGVNLGRVGFLAEAEVEHLDDVVAAIVNRSYSVQERMCIHAEVQQADGQTWSTWAMNEVVVSRSEAMHVVELLLEIDSEPLSRLGADGIIVSTAAGSTAYAFSAGGPIIWPEVQAMCVVPVSAHALFARPLVVAHTSEVCISNPHHDVHLWADGHRHVQLAPGARVTITRHREADNVVRLDAATFTGRLVRKFKLPVQGWRADAGRLG